MYQTLAILLDVAVVISISVDRRAESVVRHYAVTSPYHTDSLLEVMPLWVYDAVGINVSPLIVVVSLLFPYYMLVNSIGQK